MQHKNNNKIDSSIIENTDKNVNKTEMNLQQNKNLK